ncbi:MAG: hypothetical protein ACRDLB_10955 [Actinomycetota bacterium]
MSRAWPFESKSEGIEKVREPRDFLRRFGTEGTEAVVIRIGMNDAQLLLVDGRGYWDRWVYHSVEDATRVAEGLGLSVHEGGYPEETRVRIGKYQPGAEHYDRAAYPEQGEVGPVIPYPENRPRRVPAAAPEEKSQGAQ